MVARLRKREMLEFRDTPAYIRYAEKKRVFAMTTVTINLPDHRAAALKASAAAYGLSLEDWIARMLATAEETPAKTPRSPQEAVAHILELQKHVKPDPEGWTVKDYINYGRP